MIEIVFAMMMIKDGNKVRFVCKNPKIGYFIFVGFFQILSSGPGKFSLIKL